MLNRVFLFTAVSLCFLQVTWGIENDPKVPIHCNLLMEQLLNHSVRNGSLKEGRNFFSSTYEKFPGVFENEKLYRQELTGAVKRSHFIKDLGFDESRSRHYLFESQDSLGRTWTFLFKVNQGDMTLDGEFVSADLGD